MRLRSSALAVCFAFLAAALYAVNVPLSKELLHHISPTVLAGLLYLGAGCGTAVMRLSRRMIGRPDPSPTLERRDLPYTLGMVVLDIAAPIFLMLGVASADAANVSLLNNFEIVATALLAWLLFRETIHRRLWTAIVLIVAASVLLGYEGVGALSFNRGSFFVLLACLCWGLENNCTRRLSDKSAEQIVVVKGLFSGGGVLLVALILRESIPGLLLILCAMGLGFLSYGLSINVYIRAQKSLGAARTSAFYAVAPFFGVAFSFAFLGEQPSMLFWPALLLMMLATAVLIWDTLHTVEENP